MRDPLLGDLYWDRELVAMHYFFALVSVDDLDLVFIFRASVCMDWRLQFVSRRSSCGEQGSKRTWGTRPFGSGRPKMPPTKEVHPSRKKSQWNPAGFFRGNCLACAVKLLTF